MSDLKRGLWVCQKNPGKTVHQIVETMERLGHGGYLEVTTPDIQKLKAERDRLEAMCEKMAEALDFYSKFTSYNETEIDGEPRIPVYWEDMSGRRARLALIEYRAMRAETKMPCPDKDIDPFG